MRKKFFVILALPLVLAACNKSGKCGYSAPSAVASATEIASLKTYLGADTLTYTQHLSGIFYKITAPGSGNVPSVCSDVTVTYSGRLINSQTPFDQSTSGVAFTLGQLIPGWQIGIPLIKKGGSITLCIPPSLGYGSAGAGASIPPNSYLVFTIGLLNVQ